jgi:Flp pilus assembly pilin Flp
MKNICSKLRNLWSDESGQGTAEYVLLLVLVVAVVMLFGPKLKEAIMGKVGDLTTSIQGFNPGN